MNIIPFSFVFGFFIPEETLAILLKTLFLLHSEWNKFSSPHLNGFNMTFVPTHTDEKKSLTE
jgi:hypothetical protein